MRTATCLIVTLTAATLPSAQAGTLRVVTTTTDLKSLAEAVGGNRVQVTAIAQGNQDPHHIEAKPSYILQARRADLWVRAGLDLEVGWEAIILEGSRNRRIQIGTPGHLDASEGIEPTDVAGGLAHPRSPARRGEQGSGREDARPARRAVLRPPSAALLLARRLVIAAVLSAAIALLCTFAGLWAAFRHDLPTNHVIAVAAFAALLLACLVRLVAGVARRRVRARTVPAA